MPGGLSVASSLLIKQVVFLCNFSKKQGKDLTLHAMPKIMNIIRKFLKLIVSNLDVEKKSRSIFICHDGASYCIVFRYTILRDLAFLLENRKNRSISVTARASINEW